MSRPLAQILACGFAASVASTAWPGGAEPPPRAAAPAATVNAAKADDDAAAYRGRENHATAVDGLAWVPRVVFFPAFLVTEFVLRRPIYALSGWVDRAHVVPILDRALNPTPQIHWFPALSLDLSRYFAAGAQARFTDLGARGHVLDVLNLIGEPDWWDLRIRDTWTTGAAYFGTRVEGYSRGDRAFFGFGPDSLDSAETHFRETQVDAHVMAGVRTPHLRVEATEGFRMTRTGATGGDSSIETRFDTSKIPGYGEIRLLTSSLEVRLDSRRGLDDVPRLSLLTGASYGHDVGVPERSFVRVAADLRASVQVSRPFRVLTARGYATDAVPLGDEPVPFTELPLLGADNLLGFTWGRFRGDSAVLFELGYRYPIAYYFDANFVLGVGNTFGREFEGFDVEKLAGSFSLGVRTRETGLPPITVLVGFGTTRFDEAFGVTSTRLVVQTEEGL